MQVRKIPQLYLFVVRDYTIKSLHLFSGKILTSRSVQTIQRNQLRSMIEMYNKQDILSSVCLSIIEVFRMVRVRWSEFIFIWS